MAMGASAPRLGYICPVLELQAPLHHLGAGRAAEPGPPQLLPILHSPRRMVACPRVDQLSGLFPSEAVSSLLLGLDRLLSSQVKGLERGWALGMWLVRKGRKFNLPSICSADTVNRASGEAERKKRRFGTPSPTQEGQPGASRSPEFSPWSCHLRWLTIVLPCGLRGGSLPSCFSILTQF